MMKDSATKRTTDSKALTAKGSAKAETEAALQALAGSSWPPTSTSPLCMLSAIGCCSISTPARKRTTDSKALTAKGSAKAETEAALQAHSAHRADAGRELMATD